MFSRGSRSLARFVPALRHSVRAPQLKPFNGLHSTAFVCQKTLKDLSESFLSGTNSNFVDDLYAQYLEDPKSVSRDWAEYFSKVDRGTPPGDAHSTPKFYRMATGGGGGDASGADMFTHQQAALLIRAFEVRGHMDAKLDPLGLLEHGDIPELKPEHYGIKDDDVLDLSKMGPHYEWLGTGEVTVGELVGELRTLFCDTVGYEFMHIQSRDECNWIRDRIKKSHTREFSKEDKLNILDRLTWSDSFEKFLAKKHGAAKRFGLDGAESLIPGMKTVIDEAARMGVDDVVIGMPHRGRLNVLANVVRKPMDQIFREFQGEMDDFYFGSGDVKYHLGTSYDRPTKSGHTVHLSLVANPSHLEAVNTVVLGKTRARQHERVKKSDSKSRSKAMAFLLHGDAAFAGQGIVYETLHLAGLPNYTTGGTVHIVVNNQVGFTTDPRDGRSSRYCTDVAKTTELPVFHVNGDDPEAVVRVCALAVEYRQTFGKDCVVDIVCYRRFGHNEVDEPNFTQPLMYQQIRATQSTRKLYATKLIEDKVITQEEADEMERKIVSVMEARFKGERDPKDDEMKAQRLANGNNWKAMKRLDQSDGVSSHDTGVTEDVLREIGAALTKIPDDLNVHRTLRRIIQMKQSMFEEGGRFDWATAEALAVGSLLLEGTHVRLSGQDCQRGTFSHRHAVWHDQKTGKTYVPLNHIRPDQRDEDDMEENFTVSNSPLDEFGVMGFELGYAMDSPNNLVMWEAQFGDFANGSQVIVDQFLSSGEQKWIYQMGLTLLLPHGYDGQGPEHSSARLERFLQMSDGDPDVIPNKGDPEELIQAANWQVCNITTPANYFHVLRRQIHRNFRKPLVIMSPKALLRHPLATSSIEEFTNNKFAAVLSDDDPSRKNVRKVVFCSGQIYYDVWQQRKNEGKEDIAIVRVEQLAPFPFHEVVEETKKYPDAEVVWCQEESKNMGAWTFVNNYFRTALDFANHKCKTPKYAGRPPSAAPATGIPKLHVAQKEQLINQALS